MLKKLKARGFTLIELMIVVAIIGILAAIAIPNFVRFQAKSKQSEAKTNLKALFTAQRAFYGEKDKYETMGDVIGWTPEAGNRYSYALTGTPGAVWTRSAGAAMPSGGFDAITNDTTRYGSSTANDAAAKAQGPGVTGTCPACQFQGGAAANVDNDTQLDTWTIATLDGTVSGGTGACAPPDTNRTSGVPTNVQNDVTCDN